MSTCPTQSRRRVSYISDDVTIQKKKNMFVISEAQSRSSSVRLQGPKVYPILVTNILTYNDTQYTVYA